MSPRPMNFAITGVAGFVAPRHLKAIHETGNRLVAAVDPHDAVGLLDRYAFDVRFFTEFERFDRHLEKLRRGPADDRVQYVSVCSPNYLHDSHIRLALRIGADAICEKPLVINPWNLDGLQELEREAGQRVYTVLQLRLHPSLVAFREPTMDTRVPRRSSETSPAVNRRAGAFFRSTSLSGPRSSVGVDSRISVTVVRLAGMFMNDWRPRIRWSRFDSLEDPQAARSRSDPVEGFIGEERAKKKTRRPLHGTSIERIASLVHGWRISSLFARSIPCS